MLGNDLTRHKAERNNDQGRNDDRIVQMPNYWNEVWYLSRRYTARSHPTSLYVELLDYRLEQ
jgi:hypothetical protein